MIGRLLSGRYRIEAVVGTGGMAVVYRALDIETGRTVAIKVLRPEYESDMEFVRRFSREAEAAAKMSHENIVNLLDVGIDNEMRYIVMEYVDGRTLKEMIREEGRIHPDVALRMTLRILAAVDHAHRNGIVHRDIKPQNILVDMDGQVKVADFGIARLKTAQSAEADGDTSALGSVHYLSPEQARGEVADEQSDLYSVGIVLYEMLTGHVPFDGDTSVSVALKHVSEAPRSMRSHNPHISKALDEVVMRALCKDQERRYQTAAEMAADLRKTITNPKGGFVQYPKVEGEEPEKPERRGYRRAGHDSRRGPGRDRAVRMGILIGAVVLVCAMVALAFYLRELRDSVIMPNLIGQEQTAALEAMESLGIETTVVNAYSEEYEGGSVMLQSREAGDRLRRDAQITLTVSLGSQWYLLADMRGWEMEEALSALEAAGVAQYGVSFTQSDDPVGTVVSVDCEPGWTSRDVPITVKVSGHSVSVPSLTGLDFDAAREVVETEGLTLGEVTLGESADAKVGNVIAQSVAPYTQVLAGSAVDLVLCGEREPRYTPDAALTLAVPLNNLEVSVELIAPSGQTTEAYREVLGEGTHSVSLVSAERGWHTVNIYMAGTLFESLQLNFE